MKVGEDGKIEGGAAMYDEEKDERKNLAMDI